jgi:hypothetical protein
MSDLHGGKVENCFDCKFDKMCYVRMTLTDLANEMANPINIADPDCEKDGTDLLTHFMKGAKFCHRAENEYGSKQ